MGTQEISSIDHKNGARSGTALKAFWQDFHLQREDVDQPSCIQMGEGGPKLLSFPHLGTSGSELLEHPGPQQHYIHNQIPGEFIFGLLHKFHVIHSASRNYTWKAGILCVTDGVCHYIEQFWGT